MKTLICVAPDGSVELWYKADNFGLEQTWVMQNDDECNDTWGMGEAQSKSHPYGPEFWGREILGEL